MIEIRRATPRLTMNSESIEYIINDMISNDTFSKNTKDNEEVLKFILANLIYNRYISSRKAICVTTISSNRNVWKAHKDTFGFNWFVYERIKKVLDYLIDKKYIGRIKTSSYKGTNCYLIIDKRLLNTITKTNYNDHLIWRPDYSELENTNLV